MKTALYPGTFDPLTFGHIDIIERAAALFDRVIVTVAKNPKKTPLFTAEEREDMIREAVKSWPNVTCESFDGLLVQFAKDRQAKALIRGLRVISDFEYELQMAHVNRRLAQEVVTILMMPGEKYTYLNSSIVKEVASFGGDIQSFVPPFIADKIKNKLRQK
ncbi:pantetheine-phosphate adenylyltransferase [bacterium]|nr:MAG: pantetheine-phosphate adenylyltransferase [bacterium]